MQILVRDADGFVLNSSVFNSTEEYEQQLLNGIDEGAFSEEYYTVQNVDITPDTDKKMDGFIKLYFYENGELVCKYSATSRIDEIIKSYEDELSSTDYIIVKAYERTLMDQPIDDQYNYGEIANRRQWLRNEINELRQLKQDNPTIITYKPEYMKPIEE